MSRSFVRQQGMDHRERSWCVSGLIVVVLLVAGCGPNQLFGPTITPTPTPTELESTSAIYREALAHGFQEDSDNSVLYCSGGLVLYYMTESYEYGQKGWEWIHGALPKVEQETSENFYKINLQSINMPENLDLRCQYALITDETLEGMDANNSTGFFSLSRIGFNSRKDQALVDRGYSDGYFCYGNLLYLERIDGIWKVTDILSTVVC